MRDNLLPENKYQPGFTPMIINTGKELILFDTGNGAKGFVPRPQGGWLAPQLAPAGFKPEEIDRPSFDAQRCSFAATAVNRVH